MKGSGKQSPVTHLYFECTHACKEFTILSLGTAHDLVRIVCHVVGKDGVREQVLDYFQTVAPYQTHILCCFKTLHSDFGGLPFKSCGEMCQPTKESIRSFKQWLWTVIELFRYGEIIQQDGERNAPMVTLRSARSAFCSSSAPGTLRAPIRPHQHMDSTPGAHDVSRICVLSSGPIVYHPCHKDIQSIHDIHSPVTLASPAPRINAGGVGISRVEMHHAPSVLKWHVSGLGDENHKLQLGQGMSTSMSITGENDHWHNFF